MSAEKRINHPSDMLRVGQVVKAQLLAIDPEKRQLRLGMKQLVPTGLDEFIAEHKMGDIITGRMMDQSGSESRVELGEGVQAVCRVTAASRAQGEEKATALSPAADLASLSSMLKERWKSGAPAGTSKTETVRAGQVRSFRITKLDVASKTIEVEPA
jgi:small subunit ribosomal protein S1